MFGQKIIREDKDGWIDVKYKDSWTYTVMPKKKYYLQLLTFCDDFGSWLIYPISDICAFFVNKFAFIWLSFATLFISKVYVEDITTKYWIHYGIVALWIFIFSWVVLDGYTRFPIFVKIGLLLAAEACAAIPCKVFNLFATFANVMRVFFWVGIAMVIIGIIQYLVYTIVCKIYDYNTIYYRERRMERKEAFKKKMSRFKRK